MLKLIKKLIVFLAVFAIIYYILFDIVKIEVVIKKYMYPLAHEEYVEKYSKEYGVDKCLIYAIIKTESNFNKDAHSSKDARGLMQIIESTANEVCEKIDYKLENVEELKDPETNIMIGTKYFSYLLNQFNQNEKLAIISYNAGIGKVNQWIEEGTINADGTNLENVPYKETNNYLRKVLREYEVYKELYEKI